MKIRLQGMVSFFVLLFSILMSGISFAAPFSIVPQAGTTLPTQVVIGNIVNAFYTVTNTTASPHSGNYVKTLPPNVTQVLADPSIPNLCGSTFQLNPNANCTLELNINGAVNASDPNPAHHLFVCLGGCTTCCAGTNFPLNVTTTSGAVLVSLSISPLNDTMPISATQQFVATANYSDGSAVDVSSQARWASTNGSVASISTGGLVTANSAGGTTISATFGGLSASTPLTVAIRAYTANAGTNSIIVCQVNSTSGALSACVNNSDASFNLPLGVILNTSANFAYVANFSANTVSICGVDHSTGSFSTCSSSTGGSTFNGPQRAMLNPANTLLYVANGGSSTISICPVIDNGASLGACATPSTGDGTFNNPQDIIFSPDGTYAYVANVNNTISICTLNNDGSFKVCTATMGNDSGGTNTFNVPFGISFNLADSVIYVANYMNGTLPNTVSICPLTGGGSSIGTCTTTTGPNGIGTATFNFSGNTETQLWMQTTINYGYVPNSGNNTVSICPINADGLSLGACFTSTGETSGGTPLFNEPSSITLR